MTNTEQSQNPLDQLVLGMLSSNPMRHSLRMLQHALGSALNRDILSVDYQDNDVVVSFMPRSEIRASVLVSQDGYSLIVTRGRTVLEISHTEDPIQIYKKLDKWEWA